LFDAVPILGFEVGFDRIAREQQMVWLTAPAPSRASASSKAIQRAAGSLLARASAPSANGPRKAMPLSRLILTAVSASASTSARRPARR
jgi:hypothetical protein